MNYGFDNLVPGCGAKVYALIIPESKPYSIGKPSGGSYGGLCPASLLAATWEAFQKASAVGVEKRWGNQ